VTSLKFLRFLKGELETPHVVSYFGEIYAGRAHWVPQDLGQGKQLFKNEPQSDDFLSPKHPFQERVG
jgi:hypothetical protein